MGLGMTMTLPCAIRISCDKAKYGFVFPRRGLTMESSSSFFLPRLIGYSNAMYLLTTGGIFPPSSPHFGRLFAETYPDAAQVVTRALALATEIAENVSPMASYLSRTLMWRNPGSAEDAHLVDSAVLYHMFGGRYVLTIGRFLCDGRLSSRRPGTRRKAFRRFSKREGRVSRPVWSRMLPRASLGGRRWILDGGQRSTAASCERHRYFTSECMDWMCELFVDTAVPRRTTGCLDVIPVASPLCLEDRG